jgi:hypothetical protein
MAGKFVTFKVEEDIFLFTNITGPGVVSIQPVNESVTEALPQAVKRTIRDVDSSFAL